MFVFPFDFPSLGAPDSKFEKVVLCNFKIYVPIANPIISTYITLVGIGKLTNETFLTPTTFTLCTLGLSLNNEIFGLFYHFTIYVHFMQIHKMS